MSTFTDLIEAYGQARENYGYTQSEDAEGRRVFTQGTIEQTEASVHEARDALVNHLRHHGLGWALEPDTRPDFALPTEPGWYMDFEGDFWSLDEEGWGMPRFSTPGVLDRTTFNPSEFVPFTPATRPDWA